ncbi:MAG: transglutaminase TgpA family protein [Rhodanobacteraceae bacterium]
MRDRISQHAFDLVTIAVTATIAMHLPHLPPWLWIGISILLAVRIAMRRRFATPVSAWIRIATAGLLLIAVISQYGNLFGREPGSALGCGLLALKLLETERPRDARVAIGFAGFVLMSALLFVQTIWFTLMVSAVLVILLAALVALQPAPADDTRPLRAELRLATILLACGMPLAAAGFLLIPRLGSPLWGSPGNDMQARSGLSEEMEPGALSELLLDDSPAFRVRFDGAPPAQKLRYFRAIVLWDFDGATWTRNRRANYPRAETIQDQASAIDYTITLEPTDRRWLPALDLPLSAPAGARLGGDRVLVADDPVSQPREYSARSSTRYTLSLSLPLQERERALALPDDFDAKTHALALGWRASGQDDAAVVQSALELFNRSFTYTLNPPLLGRDSIDDFLFSTRKGYCEHYSAAFVVLMRAAGIPARVVTGYQGGWWNGNSAYLLVRNSDAHAWAEVWLRARGWVRVDPTAAVSPARIEIGAAAANDSAAWSQLEWLRAMRNRFDVINGYWTQAIVRFDALRQRGLMTSFGMPNANQGDLLLAFSAVLGFVLLLATFWAMRDSARPRVDALDHAWARFGQRLARAGVVRHVNEGPLDLLARARAELPGSSAAMTQLVQNYVALRYGAIEPAPDRVRSFTRSVRSFRVRRRVAVPAVSDVQR